MWVVCVENQTPCRVTIWPLPWQLSLVKFVFSICNGQVFCPNRAYSTVTNLELAFLSSAVTSCHIPALGKKQ